MKVKSSFVSKINSFEAGFQIGKELKEIEPKLIFLFATTRYDNYSELITGIKKAINDEVDVVGMTGDSVFKEEISSIYGVSAIGINPQDSFSYEIVKLKNNTKKEEIDSVLKNIDKDDLKTALIFSHNLSFETAKFIEMLQQNIDTVSVASFSGSKTSCASNFVFYNDAFQNETVLLLISGKTAFITNTTKGWHSIGETVQITKVEKNVIKEINGIKALDFYEQRLGIKIDGLDLSLFPLNIYELGADFTTVAPVYWDLNTKEIEMPIEISEGQYATIALASIDKMQEELEININKLTKPFFKPAFGVLLSDISRRIVLGGKTVDETKKIAKKMPAIPLIGVSTSGIFSVDFIQKNEYSSFKFSSGNAAYLFLGEEIE